MANNGIGDVSIITVGSAVSDKVVPALTKLGFKAAGTNVKYNDDATPVDLISTHLIAKIYTF